MAATLICRSLWVRITWFSWPIASTSHFGTQVLIQDLVDHVHVYGMYGVFEPSSKLIVDKIYRCKV